MMTTENFGVGPETYSTTGGTVTITLHSREDGSRYVLWVCGERSGTEEVDERGLDAALYRCRKTADDVLRP